MSRLLRKHQWGLSAGLLFFLLIGGLVLSFQQGWLLLFRMKNLEVMWPTVRAGDLVLAESLSLRWKPPQAGQIVIFRSEGIESLEAQHGINPPWAYVQRVVAVPGDIISVQEGELLINQQAWQPAVWDGSVASGTFLKAGEQLSVPAGNYFVMGDHYRISEDSRHWGWVPQENLIARVLWVFRADE